MSLSSTDTSGIDDDDDYEDIGDTNFEDEDDDDINDGDGEIITTTNNDGHRTNISNSNDSSGTEYQDALDTTINSDQDEYEEQEEEEEEEAREEMEREVVSISDFRSIIMNLINQHTNRLTNSNNYDGNDDEEDEDNDMYQDYDDDDDEDDDDILNPILLNYLNQNSYHGNNVTTTNNKSKPIIPMTPITDQTINSQIQIRTRDQNTKIDNFLLNRELSDKRKENIRISQHYLPINKYENVSSLDARVFCCKITSDGKRLMTASQDKKIRIFNTSNYEEIKTIDAIDINWSIIDTDYSPDQNWLIYSSWSRYIQLVRVNYDNSNDGDGNLDQDEFFTPKNNSNNNNNTIKGGIKQNSQDYHESLYLNPNDERFCVFGLKFSPNNKEILCGCSDGNIIIYDLERRGILNKIRGHSRDVNSVCYLDHTGNVFATGSDDSLIKVWDKRSLDTSSTSNKPVGAFIGHSQGITHVTSKDDGTYLLSNGKDQTAKLWDIRKMADPSRVKPQHSSWDYRYITTETLNNNNNNGGGNNSASGSNDVSLMTYRGHQVIQTLIRCYFSPIETTSQKYIYTGSFNGVIYIYDVLTGQLVRTLEQKNGPIRDLCWSPTDLNLISANWNGMVTKWDQFDDIREF